MFKRASKHWRRRAYVAVTLAAGMLLLAAPAWAKWSWKTP